MAFAYVADTGIIHRTVAKGRAKVGPVRCHQNPNGYLYLKHNYKNVLYHRLAWFIHNGVWPDRVDHINGIKTDNRLVNLRDVSPAMNSQNMALSKRNKSGMQGIRRVSVNRWRADKSSTVLGHFACLGQAIKARQAAVADYHPNHGRRI